MLYVTDIDFDDILSAYNYFLIWFPNEQILHYLELMVHDTEIEQISSDTIYYREDELFDMVLGVCASVRNIHSFTFILDFIHAMEVNYYNEENVEYHPFMERFSYKD